MQYYSKNLLDFLLEIGLEFVKFAPIEAKNATMEFWKLLCMFCPYNRTQRQLTTADTNNS